MNPAISLHMDVLAPGRLESIALGNAPIVPPDSVIKTFSYIPGTKIDFVITQDKDGLAPNSFIVRNGEWSKFFLDSWFDPIYRSYNFQKAESHALEHIVQYVNLLIVSSLLHHKTNSRIETNREIRWHGTILAKLAVVPQKFFNAYAIGPSNPEAGPYKEGDLVATFHNCDWLERSCIKEQREYLEYLEKVRT